MLRNIGWSSWMDHIGNTGRYQYVHFSLNGETWGIVRQEGDPDFNVVPIGNTTYAVRVDWTNQTLDLTYREEADTYRFLCSGSGAKIKSEPKIKRNLPEWF